MNATLDKLLKRFTKCYPGLLTFEMTDKNKNLLDRMIAKRIRDLHLKKLIIFLNKGLVNF